MEDLMRDAPESIPRHQHESAAALSLTPGQCNRYIVILQALRRFLPLATSLMTRMIKTISLIVLIDVIEVLRTGQQTINANHFRYLMAILPIYDVIFPLYFPVCWPVSVLARYLEKHWAV